MNGNDKVQPTTRNSLSQANNLNNTSGEIFSKFNSKCELLLAKKRAMQQSQNWRNKGGGANNENRKDFSNSYKRSISQGNMLLSHHVSSRGLNNRTPSPFYDSIPSRGAESQEDGDVSLQLEAFVDDGDQCCVANEFQYIRQNPLTFRNNDKPSRQTKNVISEFVGMKGSGNNSCGESFSYHSSMSSTTSSSCGTSSSHSPLTPPPHETRKVCQNLPPNCSNSPIYLTSSSNDSYQSPINLKDYHIREPGGFWGRDNQDEIRPEDKGSPSKRGLGPRSVTQLYLKSNKGGAVGSRSKKSNFFKSQDHLNKNVYFADESTNSGNEKSSNAVSYLDLNRDYDSDVEDEANNVVYSNVNSGTAHNNTLAAVGRDADPSVVRRGKLWQQRDALFSRWKERYFILGHESLNCFKLRSSYFGGGGCVGSTGSSSPSSSPSHDMGDFLFKIKLMDISHMDILEKRGYLTICITLLSREGKFFLRRTDGILDWFHSIKVSREKLKDLYRRPSSSTHNTSTFSSTASSSTSASSNHPNYESIFPHLTHDSSSSSSREQKNNLSSSKSSNLFIQNNRNGRLPNRMLGQVSPSGSSRSPKPMHLFNRRQLTDSSHIESWVERRRKSMLILNNNQKYGNPEVYSAAKCKEGDGSGAIITTAHNLSDSTPNIHDAVNKNKGGSNNSRGLASKLFTSSSGSSSQQQHQKSCDPEITLAQLCDLYRDHADDPDCDVAMPHCAASTSINSPLSAVEGGRDLLKHKTTSDSSASMALKSVLLNNTSDGKTNANISGAIDSVMLRSKNNRFRNAKHSVNRLSLMSEMDIRMHQQRDCFTPQSACSKERLKRETSAVAVLRSASPVIPETSELETADEILNHKKRLLKIKKPSMLKSSKSVSNMSQHNSAMIMASSPSSNLVGAKFANRAHILDSIRKSGDGLDDSGVNSSLNSTNNSVSSSSSNCSGGNQVGVQKYFADSCQGTKTDTFTRKMLDPSNQFTSSPPHKTYEQSSPTCPETHFTNQSSPTDRDGEKSADGSLMSKVSSKRQNSNRCGIQNKRRPSSGVYNQSPTEPKERFEPTTPTTSCFRGKGLKMTHV